MTIGKLAIAGAVVILLAGCQTRFLPVDDAGHHTAVPASDTPPAAPISPDVPPPAPVPLALLSDTCGATGLQYLVGKPKTLIPVPVNPGKRAVICTTCEIAQGVDPARTTILFEQSTGLVTQVICK